MPWFPLLYSLSYFLMAAGTYLGQQKSSFAQTRFKLIGYFTACAAIVLLPVVQSFVILESLYGARYAYMFQAFISMALALLLFCLQPRALRNALVPLYLLLLLFTNLINNTVWTARGNDLRQLQTAINSWSAMMPPERKICLLNMPLDEKEFSSLYDLEQMRCLFKPPANDSDISNRLVQTSYLRMSSDCIDWARLKAFVEVGKTDFVISSLALAEPFKLINAEEMKKHFQPIDQEIPFFKLEKPAEARNDTSTQAIELDLKNIPCPQTGDYLEVITAPENAENSTKATANAATTIASTTADTDTRMPVERAEPVFLCPDGKTIFVLWYTNLSPIYPAINWSTARFIDDKQRRRYVFPLADRISWKCSERVDHLILGQLPVDYKVERVRLRDQSTLVPLLNAAVNTEGRQPQPAAQVDNIQADGIFPVNDKQTVHLSWDASRVENAAGVIVYISQPDFLYAPYVGGFREYKLDKHNFKTIDQTALRATLDLSVQEFPQSAKYQVRVAACDKEHKVLGYCSDPIELLVTDKPFADPFEKALFNLRAQKQN